MKLFDKYNKVTITATILTFVIGSCVSYFLLNYVLIAQLDETLQTEQQEVISYVKTHNTLPDILYAKDEYVSYTNIDTVVNTAFSTIRKTAHDNEEENMREIHFAIAAGGKMYLVKVAKPLEETEALLKVIIGVTIAMIAMILLTGYFINRVVIRRLWKPFYDTISKVKNYHLADPDTLKLEKADVDEFSLLNQSINEMVERIGQDYNSLKDFTGQAAHEMQTPLAIIRSKLDMLIQNETGLEKNAQHITDIEKAVNRLSRLHQSLLLLTKVENKQFAFNETVRLDAIIEDKCAEYVEMAGAMQLNISLSLQPTTIVFHLHLAEILISNLLNNAIRYNTHGGNVEVSLKGFTLTISNSSPNQQLNGNKLFKRFYRDHYADEGNGLGLSIVKQICDTAGYPIRYQYINGRHDFTITFSVEP